MYAAVVVLACSAAICVGEQQKAQRAGHTGLSSGSSSFSLPEPQQQVAASYASKALARLLLSSYPATAWQVSGLSHSRAQPGSSSRSQGAAMELDDADLQRELAARVSGLDRKEWELPPLAKEDVTANLLGPQDVLKMVLTVFQKAPGTKGAYAGSHALMGFSAKFDERFEPELMPGAQPRLQPGGFASVEDLGDYLLTDPVYASVAMNAEFKLLGPERELSYNERTEKVFLLRKGSKNWEEMRVELRLVKDRWLIMNLYKHNYYDDDGNELSPR